MFKSFRDVCLKYMAETLCVMTLYLTSILRFPTFAFSDAMFNLTCVEINSVYDQKMYEMIEQESRGGKTQTCFKSANMVK